MGAEKLSLLCLIINTLVTQENSVKKKEVLIEIMLETSFIALNKFAECK